MDTSNILSRSWNADPSQGLAGIGLLMQQDGGSDSPVFIKSVVAGGACERDGSISVGDGVLAVNGERVIGHSVAAIREKIVGPIGSTVSVTFERASTGEIYERSLVRGQSQQMGVGTSLSSSMTQIPSQQAIPTGPNVEYRRLTPEQLNPNRSVPNLPLSRSINQLPPPQLSSYANVPLSRSMDSRSLQPAQLATNVSTAPLTGSMNENEVSRLKSKVAEIEAKIKISQEELERTKKLLEEDRNASMKSVREIDTLQKQASTQVVDLQGQLNRSEQTRRELESQVASGRAREEEFHLAFNRAKEQTEAREQYFSDLKKQFEEMKSAYEKDVSNAKEARLEADRLRIKVETDALNMEKEVQAVKEKEKERREREDAIRELVRKAEDQLMEAKHLEEKARSKSHGLHLLFGQWHKDFFLDKPKANNNDYNVIA